MRNRKSEDLYCRNSIADTFMGFNGRGRGGRVDVESLEKDNEKGLDSLAERVGLLKAATMGIKGEVDSHHGILDNMDTGMFSARGMLGSVGEKFKLVLNGKQGRNTFLFAVVSILGLFFLWYIMHGRA
ncbi:hypothetical protein CEUSTIGMA_g1281.t1 [Chlamydomonas eustigma]|uniref:t-SNARE coiled-coil homology domain-containing protein n=1 Tax=Chlamydomonas eustigma TaxID=1157962 RepID=A0A250WTH2_9CHLO|nr:hypothetical protein CEUSTIGMA_g1281.t1 [Chlamydomonas eustigma]|eukprot:GAX73830.1 hypothetical protein CEUSTIGMA_g1281.t1 [Chlamydomonas eustigma]